MLRNLSAAFCLLLLLLQGLLCPIACCAAEPLSGGWKYILPQVSGRPIAGPVFITPVKPYDDPEWLPSPRPYSLPIPEGKTTLWLTTILPTDSTYHHPTLAFATVEQAVRVYLNAQLIYSYGAFGSEQNIYGLRWHLVELPRNYQGKQLSFHLYTDHPRRLGLIEGLSIGESNQQVGSLFRNDMLKWLALPMSALLLMILLPCWQLLPRQRSFILRLALFLLVFSAWLVTGMATFQEPGIIKMTTRDLICLISFYLMPILLILTAKEALPPKRARMMLILTCLCSGVLVAALVGELMGMRLLDSWLEFYLFFSWFALLAVAACLDIESSSGSEICGSLILPAAGLPVLQIAEILARVHILPLIICLWTLIVLWLLRHALNERQRLRIINSSLERSVAAARESAQIDALTKCYNRGQLQDTLIHETEIANATGAPLALLMFDLDHFKSINDTFGHDAGDQVLTGFAGLVRRHLDARHTFIRYGGEEFMVTCRGFTLAEAAEFADAIRADLCLAVLLPERQITCSIGISIWHGLEDSLAAFQKRADHAVYQAKGTGRNKVVTE